MWARKAKQLQTFGMREPEVWEVHLKFQLLPVLRKMYCALPTIDTQENVS